jgi:RHH-type proline utilization regulon transcriptional repressor/proline dehydrogenase/delta 1-pyrroline-5-carboxylate dehydrogenase
VEHWLDLVEVGNAYVNRHITGAIVRRQPFGGWKRSSVGGGAKAGGPGYVAQLACISDEDDVVDPDELITRFRSTWQSYYCAEHDESGLCAEANILRYVPLDRVAVRHDDAEASGLSVLRVAAEVTGVPLGVSRVGRESDVEFAERLVAGDVRPDRVRLLTSLDDDARRVLLAADIAIDESAPVVEPTVELQRWVREQAISRTLHRHGRLVAPHP